MLMSALKIATRRVAPAIAIIALAAWGVNQLLQRAKAKQLRDFQSQLQSFSSMLDLDAAGLQSAAETSSASEMAKQFMQKGAKRYKFRTAEEETEAEQIAAQVRLDLFSSSPKPSDGAAAGASATASSTADSASTFVPPRPMDPVVAGTPYEEAIVAALRSVEEENTPVADAATNLSKAQELDGLDTEAAKPAFNKFVSRFVSEEVDKAITVLKVAGGASPDQMSPEHATTGLVHLRRVALLMQNARKLAEATGLIAGLAYVGAYADDHRVREELYRSFAVLCLSDEDAVQNQAALQGLADMQTLLSLSDQRAEEMNKEIAKGMFQVAVSSAMADGGMTNESKEALDQLKSIFGGLLDGSADNIISEVAVMRAMYALQQMIQEEGVSEQDVADLKKMCSDLGVDIDEMMTNADAMGDALGPEAKQFVGGLRTLLKEDSATNAKEIGDMIANAALDAAKEPSPVVDVGAKPQSADSGPANEAK